MMTGPSKELDALPVIQRLIEKSREGKVKWEPTADKRAFVASIGGATTFRIRKIDLPGDDQYGQPITYEAPELSMLDDKGRLLWEIDDSDIKGRELWQLFEVARRIGNRLDERFASTLAVLDEL
jgi:hypothetical protein